MVNSFHICQCRQYNFFVDHVTSRMLYQQVWSSEYPASSKELGMECYAKQLGETKVMDKDDEEYIIEKFVQFLYNSTFHEHM